jgi:hypothetical protein
MVYSGTLKLGNSKRKKSSSGSKGYAKVNTIGAQKNCTDKNGNTVDCKKMMQDVTGNHMSSWNDSGNGNRMRGS